MATGDPDGRMAEMLSDRLTCLGMEIQESFRESLATLDDLLREADQA